MDSTLRVLDSHTGGQPTRVVLSGGPDLGNGPLWERAAVFRREQDDFRGAVCNEPRGHAAMVGALLCEPHEPGCACGVIFFNNVSTLPMCIHGTIGLVVSLAHLGRITPGSHRIDTPAGVVTACLDKDGAVSVTNVPSFRHAAGVVVDVPGFGRVTGDVAWGGNLCFLIERQGPPVDLQHVDELTTFAWAVRQALKDQGVTGPDGVEIDHIECFGPPADPAVADSRNFVLCPGKAYDRSPCGTGTSAKLACLHASGKIKPGQPWRQASILDTVFIGTVAPLPDGGIIPTITGRAWITGESTFYLDPADPFRCGIQAAVAIPSDTSP
jgi:4-hydroxyproline epimerase